MNGYSLAGSEYVVLDGVRTMKRVALTVASPSLDETVNSKFGRADFILLVDPDSMAWESLENPGKDAGSGAGIRVAQLLNDRRVTDVICGEFGPKAQDALSTAGIRLHRCGPRTTAREAVDLFKAGKLGLAGAGPRRTVRDAVLGGLGRGGGQRSGGGGGMGRGRGRGR
jgi:predicted Fe-Mo cluster-binding NifX family protein